MGVGYVEEGEESKLDAKVCGWVTRWKAMLIYSGRI